MTMTENPKITTILHYKRWWPLMCIKYEENLKIQECDDFFSFYFSFCFVCLFVWLTLYKWCQECMSFITLYMNTQWYREREKVKASWNDNINTTSTKKNKIKAKTKYKNHKQTNKQTNGKNFFNFQQGIFTLNFIPFIRCHVIRVELYFFLDPVKNWISKHFFSSCFFPSRIEFHWICREFLKFFEFFWFFLATANKLYDQWLWILIGLSLVNDKIFQLSIFETYHHHCCYTLLYVHYQYIVVDKTLNITVIVIYLILD